MSKRQEFIDIVQENIKRNGINNLLHYLDEDTDFYTAPASSMFHGNHEGGLVEHSINVFKLLSSNKMIRDKYSMETIAIVSLFHDFCKINMYKVEMRNAKDENGQWIKVPYYKSNEDFPFGHGEKSAWIVNKFINITDEEAMAINWHMGGFDARVRGGYNGLSKAFSDSMLVLETHIADMRATYLLENK